MFSIIRTCGFFSSTACFADFFPKANTEILQSGAGGTLNVARPYVNEVVGDTAGASILAGGRAAVGGADTDRIEEAAITGGLTQAMGPVVGGLVAKDYLEDRNAPSTPSMPNKPTPTPKRTPTAADWAAYQAYKSDKTPASGGLNQVKTAQTDPAMLAKWNAYQQWKASQRG